MFAAEIRRRQQLGTLVTMDLGRLTLAEYVVGTWVLRSVGSGDITVRC
jgi:hypothetical protein